MFIKTFKIFLSLKAQELGTFLRAFAGLILILLVFGIGIIALFCLLLLIGLAHITYFDYVLWLVHMDKTKTIYEYYIFVGATDLGAVCFTSIVGINIYIIVMWLRKNWQRAKAIAGGELK